MRYLIILIAVLTMSCGARKVHKEEIKVVETEEVSMMVRDTAAFHSDETHNTITSIDTDEEEMTIAPIDTTKEMKVGDKVYKNVVIKKKSKRDKTITEVKDTVKIDSASSHGVRAVSFNIKEGSMSVKSSEKEEGQSFYMWSLGFFLLLILLIFLANRIKKYLV